MHLSRPLLCIVAVITLASCSKPGTKNNATITVNGRLLPNLTTYTYGTNLLQVDQYTSYFVKSTSLTLASFEGDSVIATLKDMGIRQNPGPELYNVIALTPVH